MKPLLLLVILLGLAACASTAPKADPFAALRPRLVAEDPKPWPDGATRFADAIERFVAEDAANPPAPGQVLCIGSSSMGGWHGTLDEDLAPLPLVKRGFGGSMISDVLHYADRIVLPYKPSAILLYEGDNDVEGGFPPAQIAAAYLELVDRVHAELPETRFYILSVKPSPSRWDKWPAMQETNALLAEMCAMDERLVFVDIATPMLGPDGTPRRDIFLDDMLHMNRAGYELWTPVVRAAMAREFAGK